MADFTSPLLPLGAEIFAIRYRTHWKELGLTPPDELKHEALKLQPPMSIDQAVINVRRAVQRLKDTPHLFPGFAPGFQQLGTPSLNVLNLARLAMADLARGELLLRSSEPESTSGLLEMLAHSMESDPDFKKIQDAYEQQQRSPEDEELPRFDAARYLRSVREVQSGGREAADDAFSAAFNAQELRLLNGQRSAPPKLERFRTNSSYDKSKRVAEADVSVEVNRPFEHLRALLDPRAWSQNVPSVWPKVEVLTDDPDDRGEIGTIDSNSARPFLKGVGFYEEVVFGSGLCPVSRHRNLLRVTLDFRDTTHLTFSYRQASCLTAEIAGNPKLPGGIDVDSGSGACNAVPRAAGAPFQMYKLSASKRLRFTHPEDDLQNRLYNEINAIALPLLIETFVLFGAIR